AVGETIRHDQEELKGKLIVTMAVDLMHTMMPSLLAEFVKRYPKIELDLRGEDRTVDLVKEGVDLAFRIGPLIDSNLRALKIGEIRLIFVSTPTYLNSAPKIRQVEQLSEHPLTLFGLRQEKLTVINKKTNRKAKLKLHAHVMVNTPIAAKSLVMGGLGIALAPDFICYDEIKAGQLVRVMPEWSTEPAPFHYVWPSHIAQSPKVKALVDLTHGELKKLMSPSN
ncbi:MAG: substrate binding domain-containing protein, partial [Bdellovibrionaceae bacterium]|nr:substrate binding domain-containing protein [Pseudobdellovibrionaceae bacterium]